MGATSGAEGRQGSGHNDLNAQTDVDEDAEEAVARGSRLFGLDDARVDADVGGGAAEVVEGVKGRDAVDAGEGTEDKELVLGWNEGAGLCRGDGERGFVCGWVEWWHGAVC